jgi:hypothetical protein
MRLQLRLADVENNDCASRALEREVREEKRRTSYIVLESIVLLYASRPVYLRDLDSQVAKQAHSAGRMRDI